MGAVRGKRAGPCSASESRRAGARWGTTGSVALHRATCEESAGWVGAQSTSMSSANEGDDVAVSLRFEAQSLSRFHHLGFGISTGISPPEVDLLL